MGLDASHGAFDGAYGAFDRFRRAVAVACGGVWPPHPPGDVFEGVSLDDHPNTWGYSDDEVPAEHVAGLTAFLGHSDCDGELTPDECRAVSAFLRWVAPRLVSATSGHLLAVGPNMAAVALRFADGCDRAADADDPLVFQ